MRNYKSEYKKYQGTSTQKKNRASRNAARSTLKKVGVVKKGDGKDVNHRMVIPETIGQRTCQLQLNVLTDLFLEIVEQGRSNG